MPLFSVTHRLWAVAIATVVIVVACDRVPLTSPTGSIITLNIDRDTLPINGQTTVTAVVIESSGTAVHNGTTVTFQTSLGRIEPIEAQTLNGKATVTFMAGATSGTAVIHAFSGSARTGSGNSTAGGVSVKVGTAAAERVSVRTEPLNVPVTGGTVTVIAGLFDAGGNAISNTPIAISSDFGSLSSNSAVTDANGEARVSLTTNRTTVVTATAGSKSQAYTLTALSAPVVGLQCGAENNTAATVGLPISCSIAAVSGNSSSAAPIISMTINWGDGSGEMPVGVNSATTVSHTYTSPGSFVVTAAATDANSQRGTNVLTLNVTRSIPAISITASAATATVGAAVTFTVTPPATTSTIPIANVTVSFGDGTSRDLGAITAPTTVLKTYNNPGIYTATATATDTAGGRNTASTAVQIVTPAAPTVSLSQNGTLVGGCGSFTVTATAGSGATISSVIVRKSDSNDPVYSGNGSSTFAVCGLVVNNILIAEVRDSVGQTATASLAVR